MKSTIYLHDVIVFSRSPEEHLQHQDEVLTLLGKAGVTLKASKCHFFQEEVDFLGHVIRPGRVQVLQKNLRATSPSSGNPDPDEEFSGYLRRVSGGAV